MSAANDGDCVSVASGATSKTWRSTKRRKVDWTSQQCQNDALEILNTMPQKTRDLVISGNYGGGRIIKGVTHETPTMELCEKHYVFVFPILKQHPLKVPSPFCLADTLIALDELLERKLLVIPGSKNPTTQTEKADLAMTEAKDLKRIAAHVRYLARDGRGSYSTLMASMKAVVKFENKNKKRSKGDDDTQQDGNEGDADTQQDGNEDDENEDDGNEDDRDDPLDGPQPSFSRREEEGIMDQELKDLALEVGLEPTSSGAPLEPITAESQDRLFE